MFVRSALVEAEGMSKSITELLDHTRIGAIQLDPQGRIVESNDTATRWLRARDGLSDEGGVLGATAPDDDERLNRLLARALPRFGVQGEGGSMPVTRMQAPKNPLILHVTPIGARHSVYPAGTVAALVLVVDLRARAAVAPELVQTVLGLTQSEAEIAVLVAQGTTAHEIAAATGRGYHTVRTHIKNACRKLGVSRLPGLAQTVLALSNLPRPRE